MTITAFAPGRVNLIGDHTDYAAGLALPMAIHLGVTVSGERGGDELVLQSESVPDEVRLPIRGASPADAPNRLSAYAAAVLQHVEPSEGFVGTITSDLPLGSGLSSSAALEIALALAVGYEGSALELARLGQRAEHAATGVPTGLMDQLTITSGEAGFGLRIDFVDDSATPVAIPGDAQFVVVHSGQSRELVGSEYADRRAQVEAAIAAIGPLRDRPQSDADTIDDPVIAARGRHVIGECARVDAFAAALEVGDLAKAGLLMVASHNSLGTDFEVSTPVLDQLVAALMASDGCFGARLTGAGFGGCVVALVDPNWQLPDDLAELNHWPVHPSAGAHVTT